ncbi:MAG: DUF721 domain-containing protein [Proteobacteria bacterium]|nr:DUF721 domain-containing protein [Pseudomonadota bacterium]
MAQKRDDKQSDESASPPRRNRPEAVSRETMATAASAFVRAGFRDPTLVLRWDEIVGPEVARLARPLKLTEGASGGILTLKAEPAASLFLQHETRPLTERINAYLGRPAVAKLRFVQGPLERSTRPRPLRFKSATLPPGDPALAYEGPTGVKDALLALAKARRRTTTD